MPTMEKQKPWYSIEQGSVHFTIISTEHDCSEDSEQVMKQILLPYLTFDIYLNFSLSV